MPSRKKPSLSAVTLEEHRALGTALTKGARQIFRYASAYDASGQRHTIAMRALKAITALQKHMNDLLWVDYRDEIPGNHRQVYYGDSNGEN